MNTGQRQILTSAPDLLDAQSRLSGPCPLEHAENIPRIIRISQHAEGLCEVRPFDLRMDETKRGKVLDGEAHAVEEGQLLLIAPA